MARGIRCGKLHLVTNERRASVAKKSILGGNPLARNASGDGGPVRLRGSVRGSTRVGCHRSVEPTGRGIVWIFRFVLGYEPVYSRTGGGLYSTKWSLATALSVGIALGAPFALAGDWVRGSRCGDVGGRLAVSFCLGSPSASNVTRVSHASVRSELHPTSLKTNVLCVLVVFNNGISGEK